ncbi:hypothetical protein ACET3Z_029752 [Daucus carota]
MAASSVEAQLGYPVSYDITGKLYCTLNGSIGTNGTATPVFPGALVQVVCVNTTNPLLTGTTLADGRFTLQTPNPIPPNCTLVVPTPLSTCNSSLPATGGLISVLRSVGSIFIRLYAKHYVYIPEGFSYVPDLP